MPFSQPPPRGSLRVTPDVCEPAPGSFQALGTAKSLSEPQLKMPVFIHMPAWVHAGVNISELTASDSCHASPVSGCCRWPQTWFVSQPVLLHPGSVATCSTQPLREQQPGLSPPALPCSHAALKPCTAMVSPLPPKDVQKGTVGTRQLPRDRYTEKRQRQSIGIEFGQEGEKPKWEQRQNWRWSCACRCVPVSSRLGVFASVKALALRKQGDAEPVPHCATSESQKGARFSNAAQLVQGWVRTCTKANILPHVLGARAPEPCASKTVPYNTRFGKSQLRTKMSPKVKPGKPELRSKTLRCRGDEHPRVLLILCKPRHPAPLQAEPTAPCSLPAREFVTDAQDTMIPMELQTLEVTWPRSHIKLFPIGKVTYAQPRLNERVLPPAPRCTSVTTFLLSMPSPPIFALEMILNFHRDVRVKCHPLYDPLSWARDTRPSRSGGTSRSKTVISSFCEGGNVTPDSTHYLGSTHLLLSQTPICNSSQRWKYYPGSLTVTLSEY
ncbi:hypothetical protein Anapl_14730 [Anas platyrhynchos]|uniref:Uncharacterized protein n=1 Tax=Anas platyrhynchos TaxID=8839 RepID=R0LFQ2_ANAPL|nr:hypothetical protein Anapl_14730 [Anas platyrhynchos]